jgi:serine/threonine-protein kinase RsbW
MKFNISVPSEKSNLQRIRAFIIDVLREQHLSEVEVHSMVLAVDEVCANLIIHSNNGLLNHSIDVEINIKVEGKIVFDIIDKGSGFDLRKYPEPDINEIIRQKKKGGVGLMLVKRIMDDIDFITKEDYNIVRLTKNLQPTG